MSAGLPAGQRLGVVVMDATHAEFLQLLARASTAAEADFPACFQALVAHTRAHFEQEGRLMRQSRFPATGEHEGEHNRVLGELLQLNRGLKRGRSALVRAYVRQGMAPWFDLHLATMDSALAAHLRKTEAVPVAAGVA